MYLNNLRRHTRQIQWTFTSLLQTEALRKSASISGVLAAAKSHEHLTPGESGTLGLPHNLQRMRLWEAGGEPLGAHSLLYLLYFSLLFQNHLYSDWGKGKGLV